MADEIERKWLVDGTWADIVWGVPYEDSAIVQTYLVPTDPTATERVRQRTRGADREFTHTIKHPTEHLGHRLEQEWVITEAEYAELSGRKDPDREQIVKIRRVFEWKGHTWELDLLAWPDHAMMLEVELPSLDTQVRVPPKRSAKGCRPGTFTTPQTW